jgi:threonine dehydratase
MELVTANQVREAAERLADVVQVTPTEMSRALSKHAGVEVRLKCENLQRTGSFKLRGAYNLLAQLSDEDRIAGVVCASAGNHAQGVALAAQMLGIRATVFMPEQAPLPKVEATARYGAEVELVGRHLEEALEAAEERADDDGAVFVHPFEHPHIIAGQGTLALEILDAVPDVGTIILPVGGGGLISGVAVAAKDARPDIQIIGVQATRSACFQPSLDAGSPRPAPAARETIADGIAVKEPGELTLAHVNELVDDIVDVEDATIARAVVTLLERAKLGVEPAGAAAVAAILDADLDLDLEPPVVAVLSGGNIDLLLLHQLVTSGLTEEGRFVTVRTRVPDRPGQLHALLGLIAEERANIVAVEHHRLGRRLRLEEVEVVLELETRGPEHVNTLRQQLELAGYPIAVM